MNDTRRTVAVVGAGVIGQVYAGRLADVGCEVWLLARGSTYVVCVPTVCACARMGWIPALRSGLSTRPRTSQRWTRCFLPLRADQVTAALPLLVQMHTRVVVTLVNLTDDARAVATQIGMDRVVLGFPGVGGTRTTDGIEYHRIRQQPTTLGCAGGREQIVAQDLRAAGLNVELAADMEAWLATHTVFIAGVGAAILDSQGAERLGADRKATARMILSIRDGFTSLAHSGVDVTPSPLRTIFTRVPRLFSVPYWQRQMRSELDTLPRTPRIRDPRH